MVSEEEQAAMLLKLHENVRELIRDEIKAALEDYDFLTHVWTGGMFSAVVGRNANTPEFRNAVRDAVQHLMINSGG